MKKGIKILSIAILIAILVIGIAFVFFLNDYEKNVRLKNSDNKDMVLVNVGNGDRVYIANVLERLNQCNPKVIGMDITFSTLKDSLSDIILRNKILENNTILAYQLQNRTQQFFLNDVKYGRAESISDDKEFLSKWKIDYKNMNHFAFKVAKEYDKQVASKYFKKYNGKLLPIVFSYLPKEFKTYSFKDLNFDCEDISGKIVLLGFLGPGNEDKKRTYLRYELGVDDYSDTFGLIIIANQIAMILDDVSP